jgi:hypothetical protein
VKYFIIKALTAGWQCPYLVVCVSVIKRFYVHVAETVKDRPLVTTSNGSIFAIVFADID